MTGKLGGLLKTVLPDIPPSRSQILPGLCPGASTVRTFKPKSKKRRGQPVMRRCPHHYFSNWQGGIPLSAQNSSVFPSFISHKKTAF
ncbi:hypothetical protein ACFS07_08400 [Undibacterium arcticum]